MFRSSQGSGSPPIKKEDLSYQGPDNHPFIKQEDIESTSPLDEAEAKNITTANTRENIAAADTTFITGTCLLSPGAAPEYLQNLPYDNIDTADMARTNSVDKLLEWIAEKERQCSPGKVPYVKTYKFEKGNTMHPEYLRLINDTQAARDKARPFSQSDIVYIQRAFGFDDEGERVFGPPVLGERLSQTPATQQGHGQASQVEHVRRFYGYDSNGQPEWGPVAPGRVVSQDEL